MTKGRIPIKAAERISDQYDAPIVLIFSLHDGGDTFNVTTYGKSKALCRHAADLGRKLAKAILDGDVVPAGDEPADLPDVPTVWVSK